MKKWNNPRSARLVGGWIWQVALQGGEERLHRIGASLIRVAGARRRWRTLARRNIRTLASCRVQFEEFDHEGPEASPSIVALGGEIRAQFMAPMDNLRAKFTSN
jgi:hypothetical protein